MAIDPQSGHCAALRKEPFKSLDDAIRDFGEFFQRIEDAHRLERLSLGERYLEVQLEVVAEFRVVWAARSVCCEAHAIFKPSKVIEHQLEVFSVDGPQEPDRLAGWYDSSVFVRNVQVMDTTEIVVPSLVWLQGANYLDDIFSGPIYVSLFKHILKAVRVDSEWKENVLRVAPIEVNKCCGEDIECGPEVMNSVSDYEGEGLGRALSDREKEAVARRLRLSIWDNDVRLTVDEGADFRIEVRDMLIRTGDL